LFPLARVTPKISHSVPNWQIPQNSKIVSPPISTRLNPVKEPHCPTSLRINPFGKINNSGENFKTHSSGLPTKNIVKEAMYENLLIWGVPGNLTQNNRDKKYFYPPG